MTVWKTRTPKFHGGWHKPTYRIRPIRQWHWLRIYAVLFYLTVTAVALWKAL